LRCLCRTFGAHYLDALFPGLTAGPISCRRSAPEAGLLAPKVIGDQRVDIPEKPHWRSLQLQSLVFYAKMTETAWKECSSYSIRLKLRAL
jgi:hypothetical protein